MNIVYINNINHPALKNYLALSKKGRDDCFFIVEGEKMIEMAFKANFVSHLLMCTEKYYKTSFETSFASISDYNSIKCRQNFEQRVSDNNRKNLYVVSEKIIKRFSQTKTPQGLLAIFTLPPAHMFSDFVKNFVTSKPLKFFVLEDIQDPGNVGSIIRTAEAFSYDAIFYTEATSNPYTAKTLRASMGSAFFIPMIKLDNFDNLFDFFQANDVISIAATLEGKKMVSLEKNSNFAILIGNESKGLSRSCLARAKKNAKIPMSGYANSLNAAAAAAILAFALEEK